MDIQLVEHREEDAEVLLVHERIVTRADGDEHLVVFHDERRHIVDELVAAIDDGGFQRGIKETAHLQWYVLVLQRFRGLRVQHRRSVERQLGGFGVGEMRNLLGVLETFWKTDNSLASKRLAKMAPV